MRIGIVNDMAMAVEILRRIVSGVDDCEVAWIARDGGEAVARCARDVPDLILMDLVMPVMNGVEATRRIMQASPCPILVVTASVTGNSGLVYEAMGHGALDVVATPSLGSGGSMGGADALLRKIEQVGLVTGARWAADPSVSTSAEIVPESQHVPLIAIGSSTGGPKALSQVLAAFPADLDAAVTIVQHVDEQFAHGLADWLGKSSKVPVQLARRGMQPQKANAYIAATNDHLTVTAAGAFSYSENPKNLPYRPSVDVFFGSAARNWRAKLVGVLLTGMGRDGAEGLLEIRKANHPTIAQDEATCVVYGMPKAAAQLDAAREILPIDGIGRAVLRHL